jgi:hypothetical protein
MRWMLVMAVTLWASASLAQQPRDLKAQAQAMEQLAPMLGTWMGEGWRVLPDGQRITFTQTMKLESKAGGLAYTIEGMSWRHATPNARPSPGSFGIISFDDRTKAYQFRSFTFGELIDAPAELVRAGVFRWTVPGAAALRFTVDMNTPNSWSETGERSTDGGKTWVQTYGLTAYRTGSR